MINLSTEKTQYCCSDNRFQKQKHLTKFQSPLFATITSMRKFADHDVTLYILKCRVVPSFIHVCNVYLNVLLCILLHAVV